MPKNLFLFHLECMSQSWFWQFQSELPTLWRMKSESMYFNKCYASGSSTIFSMNGISYGSTCGVDHYEMAANAWYEDNGIGDKALFPLLHDNYGYETFLGYAFNVTDEHDDLSNFTFKKTIQHEYGLRYDREDSVALRKALEKRVKRGLPLAAMFTTCCDLGHGAWRARADEYIDNVVDMQRKIIQDLDIAVQTILDVLQSLDLMDNSLMVFFGDHGLGIYNRGSRLPWSIGSSMSAETLWVPLFFRNSAFGTGTCDKLVSTDDMRNTILGDLFPAEAPPQINLPFPGVDLAKENRSYAFSQNKFSLQNEKERYMECPKAYSVTDGKMRLETSVPDWQCKIGGMRLFLDQCDSGNCFDMLDLLLLDAQGNVTGVNRDVYYRISSRGRHLYSYYNPGMLADLARRYKDLRGKLREFVEEKERCAMEKLGRPSKFIFSQTAFTVAESMMKRKALSVTPDKLRLVFATGRPVCLFGAGKLGRETLTMIREIYGETPDAVIDRTCDRFPEGLNGVKVIPLREAADCFPDAIVIGCTGSHRMNMEMTIQCENTGLEFYSLVADIFDIAFNPLI